MKRPYADAFYETEWYKTRPPIIKRALEIWCIGDELFLEDTIYYIMGYTETSDSDKSNDPYDIMLIISPLDPSVDYDLAKEKSLRVCVKHLRKEWRH